MHFEREHDFAGTVERVATIMSDPAFQTALDLPDLARPDVVAHEVDGASHRLTLRYAYIGQLDPIAQRVVGGRKLTWVQDLRIDVSTGVGTLGFSADGVGGRADGSATVTIAPTGDASCRRRDQRRLPHQDPARRRQGRAGDRARAGASARRGGRRGRRRARPMTAPDAPELSFRPTVGEAWHHAVGRP